MQRKALSKKILVLGIDGFEPRTAKRLMDAGKMPALKEFVTRGSAREDLELLGSMPTITPPNVDNFSYGYLSHDAWNYLFYGTRS